MTAKDVRIMTLPAMKVVSFHGFGANPEDIALSAMNEWAEKHDYFRSSSARCFGFNNPDPTPGSSNYGYEAWLAVPDDLSIEDAKTRQFEGGCYAVMNCSGKIEEACAFIPASWKSLVEWLENSSHQMGKHQWLEEQLPLPGLSQSDMIKKGLLNLDLYLPIRE